MRVFRAADDLIIDRLLQPAVNRAFWHFGLSLFGAARICLGAGAFLGLIWLHADARFPSKDFYLDLFYLGAILISSHLVIRRNEQARTESGFAPLVRATGFFSRSIWLVLIIPMGFLLPLSPDVKQCLNLSWLVAVLLPNWIVCCRTPPAKPLPAPARLAAAMG